MIRNTDLFSIARSGVNASNQLLSTTGNNIANVNTEGYVRERTSFVAELTGGVGQSTTGRVLNVFAQNQLRRDTTLEGEFEAYWNKATVLDNVIANEANSISTGMSRFFASLQTASDDATSIAARQQVLANAESLMGQVSIIGNFLTQKEQELNLEIDATINRVNSLVQSIAELNSAVRISQANNRNDEPGALKNERDNAILELASLVSVETRVNGDDDGAVLVNLTSGESLVLQDGSFNLLQTSNSADLNSKSIQMNSNGKPTTLNIFETEVGGKVAGLFRYRDEILDPSRRQLGQIALALTDTMNTQNRMGMDFDQQLGGDIFSRPEFIGLNYPDNANPASAISGRVTQGKGKELTSADYQVTFDAVAGGLPATVDVTVTLLNGDGSPVMDVAGLPISQSYTGLTAQAGTFNEVLGGLELEFADGATYSAGDQFLLQPSKDAAEKIAVTMTRPEDLALASPMRVGSNPANLGDATVVSTKVSNTSVDNTFTDLGASGFDGAGAIQGPGTAPGGGVGAPAEILFTSATDYQVLDSAGTVITTVTGASDFKDMLAQAQASGAAPPWPAAFSALDDYPGYDLSLQGIPKAGDSFSISYNTDGLNDNRNALDMASIQDMDTMQLNNNGTGSSVSFHEAYTNIVSDIGQKSASADISLKSAQALKSQSKDWFQSVSGVSLDEEAANLVRYQQSYAAAARLLGTAQDLFNTILSAVR